MKEVAELRGKYKLGTSYIKDRNTFVTCYQLRHLAGNITTQHTPSDYRYVPFKRVCLLVKKKKKEEDGGPMDYSTLITVYVRQKS